MLRSLCHSPKSESGPSPRTFALTHPTVTLTLTSTFASTQASLLPPQPASAYGGVGFLIGELLLEFNAHGVEASFDGFRRGGVLGLRGEGRHELLQLHEKEVRHIAH